MNQHNRRSNFLFLVASFILFFSQLYVVNAELPPSSYDRFKSEASEYIKIKILNVETENIDSCQIGVIYLAVVVDVYRSNSDLQVSDKIKINSWNIKNNLTCVGGGPRVPTLLAIDWVGSAYLNPIKNVDNNFNIAAHSESFEEIDPGNLR